MAVATVAVVMVVETVVAAAVVSTAAVLMASVAAVEVVARGRSRSDCRSHRSRCRTGRMNRWRLRRRRDRRHELRCLRRRGPREIWVFQCLRLATK